MSRKLILSVAILLATNFAQAQSYSKILKEALSDELRKQMKGYQIFDYPTDNFGLITTFRKNTKDENFKCAMLDCIGKKNDGSLTENLTMDGFAAIGTGGGTITIEEVQKKQLALSFILPKIYKILNISNKIDNEKITNIKLNVGPIVFRKLIPGKYEDYLKTLPADDSKRQLFNSGKMVFITADCVIQTMSIEISLDKTSAMSIDGSVGWDATTVAAQVLDKAELGLKISKSTDGKYTFELKHPVVFARLAKKQNAAGSLNASTKNYEEYPTVDADEIILEKK